MALLQICRAAAARFIPLRNIISKCCYLNPGIFILSMVLCCGTVVANSATEETSDEQRTKEAIGLWVVSEPLELMLLEPKMSESDIQIGKQLLDQVRVGEPEFEVGLVYNATVEKAL
uniref:Uncharacterized protein n=1 Tax=Romanomermis culicivorax TaxID=13658 RepID=A0A915JFE5_ROMCU